MRPATVLGTTAATAITAFVGSVASRGSDSRWYRRLRKPSFQPPASAFPIVWTALYADIAVTSAAAIDELTRRRELDARRAYVAALAANLVLNGSWSWVFFKGGRLVPATVVAALLAASSADLVRRTARRDHDRIARGPGARSALVEGQPARPHPAPGVQGDSEHEGVEVPLPAVVGECAAGRPGDEERGARRGVERGRVDALGDLGRQP